MIDETLIADLGISDIDALELLNDHFGEGTDGGMESLIGEHVADLQVGKLIKGRVIGFSGDDVVVEVASRAKV
jgi:hypothetical protein